MQMKLYLSQRSRKKSVARNAQRKIKRGITKYLRRTSDETKNKKSSQAVLRVSRLREKKIGEDESGMAEAEFDFSCGG